MVRFIILLFVAIACFNNEYILASARTSSSANLPDAQLAKKLKTSEIDGAFINAAAVLARFKVDAAQKTAPLACPPPFELPTFPTISAATTNVLNSATSKKELTVQVLNKQKTEKVQADSAGDKVQVSDENYNPHTVKTKEKERFECDLCQKSYTTKGSLNVHMRTHDNSRNFHCLFNDCTWKFNRPQDLNQHVVNVHKNGLSSTNCIKCGLACLTPEALEFHVSQNHRKKYQPRYKKVGNTFVCTDKECAEEFVTLSDFYLHLPKSHPSV